jgi:hypothetical protein
MRGVLQAMVARAACRRPELEHGSEPSGDGEGDEHHLRLPDLHAENRSLPV